MRKALKIEKLQELAKEAGLNLVSWTSAENLTEDAQRLKSWQSNGFSGAMQYMQRSPEILSNPQFLMPQTKSVVLVAVAYDSRKEPALKTGFGRVARYAWGKDYHVVLPKRLNRLLQNVSQQLGGQVKAKSFSDALPLLERALGARAGLGFIGKNTMLIRPGTGSFFFLAEILWDVEIEDSKPSLPIVPIEPCGTCTNCKTSCPTSAFESDRVLDARKCISYLTIEKRGALSLWEREALGEWIFGCDICQEVCPFNHTSLKKASSDILEEFTDGVGPALDLSEVLLMRTNAEFEARFKETPLLRTGRAGLLRNAACVAVNTNAISTIPALKEALNDKSPNVRQHSLWAFTKLSHLGEELRIQALECIIKNALKDPEIQVKDEARELLEQL